MRGGSSDVEKWVVDLGSHEMSMESKRVHLPSDGEGAYVKVTKKTGVAMSVRLSLGKEHARELGTRNIDRKSVSGILSMHARKLRN